MRSFGPLAVFIALCVLLYLGLGLKPREVPSPLIDKPAPTFELAKLHSPQSTLKPADLQGQVWVFNVWASWCVACRAEHEVITRLAETGLVEVIGLNYKDEPQDARRWLQQFGNPYTVSLMDQDGRVGIDYGVYGVPETFVIDRVGKIRYKHIGPVDAAALDGKIIPLLKELLQET